MGITNLREQHEQP
ncbi:unnamed protein product, partial [Rotaria socialis]